MAPVPRRSRPLDAPPAVRCTRRFHAPTNLDPDERVWLVCDAVDFRATFHLNGRELGAIAGHRPQPRIDLTDGLVPHNELVIEIELAPDDPGEPPAADAPLGLPGGLGEVRLEIGRHAPDWQIDKLDPR
jgi:hypothetical protein